MTSPSSTARPDRSRGAGIGGGAGVGLVVGLVLGDIFAAVGGLVAAVVGLVAGGIATAVFAGRIPFRNWSPRGLSSVLMRRASSRGAVPAVSGLMAGADCRVMCAASKLMPQAAGSRWLAEAESFLFEVPVAQRHRAVRNYLITAPQVIAVSWAGHLARRTRPVGGAAPGRRSDTVDDPYERVPGRER